MRVLQSVRMPLLRTTSFVRERNIRQQRDRVGGWMASCFREPAIEQNLILAALS